MMSVKESLYYIKFHLAKIHVSGEEDVGAMKEVFKAVNALVQFAEEADKEEIQHATNDQQREDVQR